MCYCANHKNEFLEVSTIESVTSQPGTLRFLFNAHDKQMQLPALNSAQAESRGQACLHMTEAKTRTP